MVVGVGMSSRLFGLVVVSLLVERWEEEMEGVRGAKEEEEEEKEKVGSEKEK